jgi:hypothetical protein
MQDFSCYSKQGNHQHKAEGQSYKNGSLRLPRGQRNGEALVPGESEISPRNVVECFSFLAAVNVKGFPSSPHF